MAHIELHKLLKIIYTCDHTGCHATLTGDIVQTGQRIEADDLERAHHILQTEENARDQMADLFRLEGWTAVPTKNRTEAHHYCPLHRP